MDGGGPAVALAVVEAVRQGVVGRGDRAQAGKGDAQQDVQGTPVGSRGKDGLHRGGNQSGVAAQHNEDDCDGAAGPGQDVNRLQPPAPLLHFLF